MGVEGKLTNNRGTIYKPVTVLSLTLVRADGTRVNHCDRIIPVESDG